jgi:hypothetical protein
LVRRTAAERAKAKILASGRSSEPLKTVKPVRSKPPRSRPTAKPKKSPTKSKAVAKKKTIKKKTTNKKGRR